MPVPSRHSNHYHFREPRKGLLWLIAIGMTLFALLGAGIVDGVYQEALRSEMRTQVRSQLNTLRAKLEGQVNQDLLKLSSFVAVITNAEESRISDVIDSLGKAFTAGRHHIRNIGVAKGFVIRHVYPLEGNQAALGLDYRKIPAQWDAVRRIVETGKTVVAGPVNLVQGGRGLIGRTPIYRRGGEAQSEPVYWGLVSVVINMDTLFQDSGIYDLGDTIEVSIRGKDGLGAGGDIFLGSAAVFADNPEKIEIILPEGSWQIAARPKGGWALTGTKLTTVRAIEGLFVFLVALFCGLLVHYVVRMREGSLALRRSEAVKTAILDGAQDGIVTFSHSGQILEYNPSADHIFKLSLAENQTQHIDALLGEDYHPLQISRQPRQNTEINARRVDGEEFPLEVSWTQLPGTSFYTVFVRDVSEEHRARLALQRAQKMEAMGKLTGGIAHDFNNLLGVIIGNLELMQLKLTDPENRISAETALRAAKRGADLTRSLLNFARLKARSAKIVDLNETVRSLEGLIRKSLTTNIAVKLDLGEDLWPVKVDPGDFSDALLNLVINARDAMPQHGTLTITTRNQPVGASPRTLTNPPGRGNLVQVEVRDTGCGMQKETLVNVFEPFFTTKLSGHGTGLGLSMVFSFVKRSGGDVDIQSWPGNGTLITMSFPRTRIEATAESTAPLQTLPVPQGRETILVVDDEPSLLNVARAHLQQLGYATLTAGNGAEALRILDEESSVNLLFSDIVMPGNMNGYELARRAMAVHPTLKVLLTSGFNATSNEAIADEWPDSILPKPYLREELAQAIREALDR